MHVKLSRVAIIAGCAVCTSVAQLRSGSDPPTTPTAPAAPKAPAPPAKASEPLDNDPIGASAVEMLRGEAARVMPLVTCESVKRWLLACNWLPFPGSREVYYDRAARRALTPIAWEALAETDRGAFKKVELDERFYYYTRYGSPLAYARALDMACNASGCGTCITKKRIMDFGYGGIGHLRLLASIGADVVGVEVDPILTALYREPGDTGDIQGVGMGDNIAPAGKLKLVEGQWPADAKTKESVGGGFDLITSKNTLKRGYIHPAKEVDKRMLVDLGVDDKTFAEAVAGALKPGGFFVIYNICPKQNEDKYIPWADGQSPFTREVFEGAGFEVVEFDRDDTAAARSMGRALGWDTGEGKMDLENDLFAWVTIVRKK